MFKINKLSSAQKKLRRMILTASFNAGHSHLGSCLSSVDLIEAVYKIKKVDDPFILSNGHAGVALYAVLAKRGFVTEKEIETLNIHPDRDVKKNIFVSTGSLGQGLPIALGMAIANKKRQVYCMISDGEMTEGSIWEALRIASDNNINNLKILVNVNGWGAYDKINTKKLIPRVKAFGWKTLEIDGHNINKITKTLSGKKTKPTAIFAKTYVNQFNFLKGQDAHYYKMTEKDYRKAMDLLK
ncbi:MAG TPA: 1-deoxy-D-xylulose-5-phosphate synthase N-terminal domain-containing protein [Patescibacteria group bacterium]|nr:1-deoxy-D-xylulose-5-phosphate synthase N-terminal domain-containing protein [Patescibacteria group bacterium]